MVDPITLIAAIAGISGMFEKWEGIRKARLELDRVKAEDRQKVVEAGKNSANAVRHHHIKNQDQLIISQTLLDGITKHIENSAARFESIFLDPKYADYRPLEINAEQELARTAICRELLRIKSLNGGHLPDIDELVRFSKSNNCE